MSVSLFKHFLGFLPFAFHIIGDSQREKRPAVILDGIQHLYSLIGILVIFKQGVGIVQACSHIFRKLLERLA